MPHDWIRINFKFEKGAQLGTWPRTSKAIQGTKMETRVRHYQTQVINNEAVRLSRFGNTEWTILFMFPQYVNSAFTHSCLLQTDTWNIFFHNSRGCEYLCHNIICVYMWYHIFFKRDSFFFVIFHTKCNVGGNLQKIKKIMKHAFYNDKPRSTVLKRIPKGDPSWT